MMSLATPHRTRIDNGQYSPSTGTQYYETLSRWLLPNVLNTMEVNCSFFSNVSVYGIIISTFVTETAMGVSKSTQDQSGFEYAMAVMKMCDILHLRHTKIWLRPELLFNFTQYAKAQAKLLDVIHGLTKKVIVTL